MAVFHPDLQPSSDRGHLITEQSNRRSSRLDQLDTLALVELFADEDRRPQEAVAAVAPALAQAVDSVAERLRAGGLNVLKPFRAAQQRGGATGENTLHLLGITAEGGRTFRGIQHTQPSGGASTQVEEPAAGTEALSNRINRLG